MSSTNPIENALAVYGTVILDGGLATVLESRGCVFADKLWSASVLIEKPEEIYRVHYDYLVAGARCISTASYQATPYTYSISGYTEAEAIERIKLSVQLAQRARTTYLSENTQSNDPIVIAGSCGPYGAFLANGAEYRGDYSIELGKMCDFHRERVKALIESGVDVLAFETIPTLDEAKAIIHLLEAEFPDAYGWFSFTLRDEHHISDGTPLKDIAEYLDGHKCAAAIGINCVRLEIVTEALKTLRLYVKKKPIIVYPNSGEHYDAVTKKWNAALTDLKFIDQVDDWYKAGARLIGGCCRTTPDDIRAVRKHFFPHQWEQ